VGYLYMTFFYKFPTASNSEKFLKIGQYLVKLWARVRCLFDSYKRHTSGMSDVCQTTYIWSRKGLDVAYARLPTDRVLLHAHTTHSVTEVSLSRGLESGIAFQDTYATRILPTAASGVNSRHIGFLATGAQCDILLNCAL